MRESYRFVLESCFGADWRDRKPDVQKELHRLRPALRELRRAYKTGKPDLAYRADIAAAYVLACVPLYIEQARETVRLANVLARPPGPAFRAVVFGAGPGPEAVALMRYLFADREYPGPLDVLLLDRASDGWADVRNRLMSCARSWYCQGRQATVRSDTLDFVSDVASARSCVGNADLVIFQNLGNELEYPELEILPRLPPAIMQRSFPLEQVAHGLKDGATMILSDQRSAGAKEWFDCEKRLEPLGTLTIGDGRVTLLDPVDFDPDPWRHLFDKVVSPPRDTEPLYARRNNEFQYLKLRRHR